MRLGVVALSAFFMLEVLTIALYSPSFFVLGRAVGNLEITLAQKKDLLVMTNDNMPAQVKSITQQLSALRPVEGSEKKMPSVVIAEILGMKPSGIKFTAILYALSKEEVSVQLSGVSRTRADLLLFQKSLETSAGYSVKFNNSFVTRQPPIEFVVTIIVK